MSIFKETVSVDENKNQVTITVSCSKRILANESKEVYKKNVERLIPDNLKGKVKLLSSPSKKVSNLHLDDHHNVGTWVYQINQNTTEPPKPSTTKTRTTSRRRRTTKQDTNNNQNKE